MPGNRIIDLIEPAAGEYPDKPALMGAGGETLTYSCLLDSIRSLSEALHELGISKRDRIAAVLPGSMEVMPAFLSISNRAVFIPLSPDLSREQYLYYLQLFKADILLTAEDSGGLCRQAADELAVPVIYLKRQQNVNNSVFLLSGGKYSETADADKDWPDGDDMALLQFTSGTTAEPKLVPRSHKNLYFATRQRREEMHLTADDKLLITTPSHRGITLIDSLAILAAGGTAMFTDSIDPDKILTAAKRGNPTWLLGGPAVLSALAVHAETGNKMPVISGLKYIRSAGAPLNELLAERLTAIFQRPVYEGYGSTECGNIALSMNSPRGYKPGSVGVPLGIETAVLDEMGRILPCGLTGEIAVRGPQVIESYADGVSSESFRDGWFKTGDRGYIDADGYLFVLGRYKEIINRGGEKVSPYEVEAVLNTHPHILQAAVFPVFAGDGQEEVGAAAVLREGTQLYLKDLRRFLNGKVTAFKMPSVLFILEEMPVSDADKIQRKILYKKIKESGIAAQPLAGDNETIIPPHSQTEKTLYEIFTRILLVKGFSITDSFFELGGDSLKTAVLFGNIEDEFGVQVPLKDIFNNGTIKNLAQIIDANRGEKDSYSFIMPFQVNGSKTPVFFVHSADGEAVAYRHISVNFDPERPLYGINFNPDGAKWLHPITFEQIAAEYLREIRKIQPEGPYILAGLCVGGIIASEIGLQLMEMGQEAALLAVFDTILPEAETRDGFSANMIRNMRELFNEGPIEYLNTKWYYYRRLIYRKSPDMVRRIIFRGMDKRTVIGLGRSNYKQKEYPGKVVFFQPDDAGEGSRSSVELWEKLSRDISIIRIKGNHLSIFYAENAEYTREALEKVLEELS